MLLVSYPKKIISKNNVKEFSPMLSQGFIVPSLTFILSINFELIFVEYCKIWVHFHSFKYSVFTITFIEGTSLHIEYPWLPCKIFEHRGTGLFWSTEFLYLCECFYTCSVQFCRSVVSDSLWPHESQHCRPPCPSPTPGVYICSILLWFL